MEDSLLSLLQSQKHLHSLLRAQRNLRNRLRYPRNYLHRQLSHHLIFIAFACPTPLPAFRDIDCSAFGYHQATSWEEITDIHVDFVRKYDEQEHFAHRKRADGRRTPQDVLGWVKGREIDPTKLDDAFTIRIVRQLDQRGYVRFQNWGSMRSTINWHRTGSLKSEPIKGFPLPINLPNSSCGKVKTLCGVQPTKWMLRHGDHHDDA